MVEQNTFKKFMVLSGFIDFVDIDGIKFDALKHMNDHF